MSQLRDDLRRRLRVAADPAKASAMQAYMKSAMPYLGVQTTPLRAACREAFAGLALSDRESWCRAVLEIWRNAEYREERYAAIELVNHRSARAFLRLDAMPMLREMIASGAW